MLLQTNWICLATEFDFLYDRANFKGKRLLWETVIKQLNIEDGTIVDMESNSPFASIATRAESSGPVLDGGPFWTAPELVFESKKLVTQIKQLLLQG